MKIKPGGIGLEFGIFQIFDLFASSLFRISIFVFRILFQWRLAGEKFLQSYFHLGCVTVSIRASRFSCFTTLSPVAKAEWISSGSRTGPAP